MRQRPALMPDFDGPSHDLPRLIEVLDRLEVEYLIVGGAAAYAYGAERPTDDADCVVSRERTNLDRLAGALRELHARLRVGGMTDAEAQAPGSDRRYDPRDGRYVDVDDRRGRSAFSPAWKLPMATGPVRRADHPSDAAVRQRLHNQSCRAGGHHSGKRARQPGQGSGGPS